MRGIGRGNSSAKLPSYSRKGNRLIFLCWILVGRAISPPFGICLWQHNRTSSREKKAEAEISFLFKEVKREGRSGAGRLHGRFGPPPIFSKSVAN